MSSFLTDIGIVIPALNPRENLLTLIEQLKNTGFEHIILVDDGSTISNRQYFKEAKTKYSCHIIRHIVNFGKGMALKSAFNYILEERPELKGVVTVDCDGQHLLKDIVTCAELTAANPDKLIMGCRQFDDTTIPFRSRFGNKFTCLTIRLLCGIDVSDSQTGLRGMSLTLLQDIFLGTKGERFEYEMNMLITAKENMVPIEEFPIETVYLENNESSHFNPFRDSIRIYKIFLKFLLSSLSSFVIDIVIFYIFIKLFRPIIKEDYILYGTIFARCISSVYNFLMNRRQVFQNKSKITSVALRYYTLCIAQTLLSAFLVKNLFFVIKYNESVVKACVEVCLFFISFQIQREWVFKKKK